MRQKSQYRILLIEDNEADIRLIQELLSFSEHGSFQITVATSLKEALDMQKGSSFDALLLDIHLPDAHGLSTLEKVLECWENTAVIVLTGFSEHALGCRAMQLGADDFIDKNELNAPVLTRSLLFSLERKKHQNAKKEYEILFNKSSDVIFLHPVDKNGNPGNFCRVNETASKKLGYHKSDFKQMNLRDITAPHREDKISEQYKKIFRKKSVTFETSLMGRHGDIIPYEIHAQLLEIDKNALVISVARDISLRRKSDEKFRREKEKNTRYLSLAGNMFLGLDLAGNVTLINKKGTEILSAKEFEVIGENWFDNFLPDQGREASRSMFEEMLKEKNDLYAYFENEIVTQKGDTRKMLWHNTLTRSASGRVLGVLCCGTDITDLRSAERIYQEGQQKFTRIFDGSPLGMAFLDKSLCFESINQSFCRFCGYAQDELSQLHLLDIAHPDYVKPSQILIAKIFSGELPFFKAEKRYLKKNGDSVWAAETITPLKNRENKITGLLVMAEDITERKQAEDEMRLFYTAVENSLDAIFLVSLEGNILYGNEKAKELTGNDRFLGSFLHTVFPIDFTDQSILQIVQTQGSFEGETHYLTPEGETRWVYVSNYLIRSKKNHPLAIVSLIRDITKAKHAEDALRDSELRFRASFEQAAVGMAQLDIQGKFIKVNHAFNEMLGYSEKELMHKNFFDITHPDDREENSLIIKMLVDGNIQKATFEKRYVHKNGSQLWVILNTTRINNKNGELQYFITQTINITDRKNAEEQLKNSILEKDILIKEIHHRVKNNLQIISGILQLQSMKTQDQTIRDFLDNTISRVQTMALIHKQLYQEETLARLHMNTFIRGLISMLLQIYTLPEKNISIIYNIDEIHLPIDIAIPCGLIINELVSNSLKHAFEGKENGDIKISFTKFEENKINLKVEDNGKGIPSFDRIQTSPSLGLELVHVLAEQLGSTLEKSSHEGARFSIVFKNELE